MYLLFWKTKRFFLALTSIYVRRIRAQFVAWNLKKKGNVTIVRIITIRKANIRKHVVRLS